MCEMYVGLGSDLYGNLWNGTASSRITLRVSIPSDHHLTRPQSCYKEEKGENRERRDAVSKG